MPALDSINGLPMSAFSMRMQSTGPVWSRSGVDRDYFRVQGRYGAVPAGVVRGREKRVPCTLRMVADMGNRVERLDAFFRHTQGLFRLVWSDAPGRYMDALLDAVPVSAMFERDLMTWRDGSGLRSDLEVSCSFVVPAGLGFDVHPTVLGLPATTQVACPVGTAPSGGIVTAPGPFSSLTLTLRDAGAQVVGAPLVLSGSVGSGEVLEIDAGAESIAVMNTATFVRTSGLGFYVSGDFPALDPAYGTPELPPTLESSVAGSVAYRRAWE
jgi:hypothetical protein